MNTLIDSTGCIRDGARQIARTSDGRLHVVFRKRIDSLWYICYAYSDDDGQTWSDPEQISLDGAIYPAIASDSQDNIHVVWIRSIDGDDVIIHREKNQSGWLDAEVAVHISGEDQNYPAIAVDSQDNIHLVWTGLGLGDNPSIENIYYRKKDGSEWGDIELVTDG